MGSGVKKSIALLLMLLSLVSLVPLAGALYSFDGVPYPDKLDLVAHGTLQGSVYVGESRGLDFPPYEQPFELPAKITVKWARLYVGVWGGTERYEGWVQTTFNGHDLGKTSLRGINDDNPQVYCASHGVYWVYYDVTDKVVPGLNTGVAETSRGERGSKLDGRIYGIILVAIYEAEDAPETSYWVCEGNPSLHGMGWAGTIPTVNDVASARFSGALNPTNVDHAQLTVTYLAGNPDEPDYLEFNGQGIGGNDVANNEEGKTYGIDLKTFDVSRYAETENDLRVLRGKDVNGDGSIDVDNEGNLEGEYYFHPVLAVLVVQHKTAEKTMPDFTPKLELGTLGEGENTLIPEIHNFGRLYEGDVTLSVLVDGVEIYSDAARLDASGMTKLAVPWNAAPGSHTITATVDAANAVQESDEANNEVKASVSVMRNADLSVRILTPVRSAAGAAPGDGMLIAGVALVALLVSFAVLGRRAKKRSYSAVLLTVAALSLALLLSGCVDEQPGGKEPGSGGMLSYSIPIELTNEGELPAMNFELSLYVDGEKSVTKTIEQLEGGASIVEELPIVVAEGTHRIRVTADEKNVLKESRRDNNADALTFTF